MTPSIPIMLITMPASTRPRRAPTPSVIPTLPAASPKPRSVTTSPTSPIVPSSSLPDVTRSWPWCKAPLRFGVLPRLRLQEDGDRRHEQDHKRQEQHDAAVGLQRPPQAGEGRQKQERRQPLRGI